MVLHNQHSRLQQLDEELSAAIALLEHGTKGAPGYGRYHPRASGVPIKLSKSGGDVGTHTSLESAGKEIDAQGKGNCYPAAVTLMMNSDHLRLFNPHVVQGTVTPRFGPMKDKPFVHSWLEEGPPQSRYAYDYSSGNRVIMKADAYRLLGRASKAKEYDKMTTYTMLAKHQHYGPWE